MKPFAIAAVLAATLTLTACGDAPQAPAETTTTTAPTTTTPAPTEPAPVEPAPAAETPAVNVEIPANTMVPGTDMTVEQAMEAVQQEVESMNLTDAEKQEAVATARKQAEDAARAAGLTAEQIKQAGDAAEQAAKTMFGIQ